MDIPYTGDELRRHDEEQRRRAQQIKAETKLDEEEDDDEEDYLDMSLHQPLFGGSAVAPAVPGSTVSGPAKSFDAVKTDPATKSAGTATAAASPTVVATKTAAAAATTAAAAAGIVSDLVAIPVLPSRFGCVIDFSLTVCSCNHRTLPPLYFLYRYTCDILSGVAFPFSKILFPPPPLGLRVILSLAAACSVPAAFPMFPSLEPKPVADEFGLVINPNDFILPDVIMPSAVGKSKTVQDEVMAVEEKTLPPVHVVARPVTVAVHCPVRFINFEGRADGKALKEILSYVKPRKLVLVHGSDANKSHLQGYVERSITDCKQVLVPPKGQIVDISADRSVFAVRFGDAFERMLQWQELKHNYHVAWFDGDIRLDERGLPTLQSRRALSAATVTSVSTAAAPSASSTTSVVAGAPVHTLSFARTHVLSALEALDSAMEDTTLTELPELVTDRIGSDSEQRVHAGFLRAAATAVAGTGGVGDGHAKVFLGEVTLPEVKRALNQEAIQAELIDQVLVCSGGQVNIRKV
jgi:hypothetical protein